MKSLFARLARSCLFAALASAGVLRAVDADSDGIDDAIDPRPGIADPKTVLTGTGYTLTILGSNRVASLQLSEAEYDVWANGQMQSADFIALGQKIYAQFGDAFNFLIVISDEATVRPDAKYSGQEFIFSNNVGGINIGTFSDAAELGSAGAIQSLIHFPKRNPFRSGPLLHEILHRWSAFLEGIPQSDNGHWSFAGTGGQHFGWEPGTLTTLSPGNYEADGPGGTDFWATSSNTIGYGKLDLYLMGLIPASEVPDIQYAENGQFTDFATGTFTASAIRTITMNELIALNGPRVPNHLNSQKFFHALYLVLVKEPLPNDRWATFDREAYDFGLAGDEGTEFMNFFEATGGRARMTFDYLNYDLRTFALPAISGPDLPTVGSPNAYTFAALDGTTEYDLRIRRLLDLTFADGAENGAGNFDVQTTGTYDVVSTVFPHSGTKLFRLVHPGPKDQYLQFARQIRPSPTAKLRFYSRFGLSGTGQTATVEVLAEGKPWTTVYSQTGTNASEPDYTLREVSLAPFAGQTISLRFSWKVNGSYYVGDDVLLGWCIDDIEIVDCEEVSAPMISSLGTTAGFDFNPPVQSRYTLQVRGRIGQRILAWGAEKLVGTPGDGSNAPPIANDDTFDITGAGQLDVLANDIDFDADALKITGVTQGGAGRVKIVGGKKVSYTPGRTFNGQDTFTYTIGDGNGGSDSATVTVRNPLMVFGGRYSTALTQGGAPVGLLTIKLAPGGSLTGKITLNGKTYRLGGALDLGGTYTASIKRKGQPDLGVSLTFDASGGLPQVTGSLDGGAIALASSVVFSGAPTVLAPAGRYTFHFPGGTAAGHPRGSGYATGVMNKKGLLRLAGKLADAAPFTTGINLQKDNQAAILLSLYKQPKGYLYGTLTFADNAASDASGTLAWDKPNQTSGTGLYPGGFNLSVAAVGSIYKAPTAGQRALTYGDPSNATASVSFTSPEILAPLDQDVTVSTADKIAITGTDNTSLKLTLNRKTGLLTGSFVLPGQTRRTKFNGAILQKSNTGFGVLPGTAESGKVTFTPSP